MFDYCEIIQNGPQNRGDVQKIPNNIQNYDFDYYGKKAYENYHSAFMHTEDYKMYDNHGTKKGYDGHVFSNYIFWDMDNINLEQARLDAIELVDRLKVYNPQNIRIYFSGGKGFHVYYVSTSLQKYLATPIYLNKWNDIVKSSCCCIAEDLKSFDRKVYDKTRIIRTTNSQHGKTGLYKIPITEEELRSNITNIRSLAKEQRAPFKYNVLSSDEEFLSLIENNLDAKETSVKKQGLFTGDELFDGIINGFPEGSRNTGIASLTGLLHSRGIQGDILYALATTVNNKSSDPLTDSEISGIINSISRYPVSKDVEEAKDEDIVNIVQAGEKWENTITKSGFTSFGERFPHLNDRLKTCIPGDVIGFLASSGTGKSTMGLELGNCEARASGKMSLFGSLEMSREGCYYRAATIEATELDRDGYVPSADVVTKLLDSNADLKQRVHKQWENLLIIDRGGLSLDKLVEYFYRAQDLTKGNISNFVIDYFQNLDGVENISVFMETSRRLKDVAKDLGTKLICLLQTNKMLPDDYTEVQRIHCEGSSSLIQSCDYIIAAWRSRDDKRRLHAKMLKSRFGESNYIFDLYREGLKYHSVDYVPDSPFVSGGL